MHEPFAFACHVASTLLHQHGDLGHPCGKFSDEGFGNGLLLDVLLDNHTCPSRNPSLRLSGCACVHLSRGRLCKARLAASQTSSNLQCCVMRHAYTWWCLSRCVLHAVSRPMSPSKADCLATFFTFRTLEGCSNKNVFKKGLRDRNSPMCTLSQNGYGARALSRGRPVACAKGSAKDETPGSDRGISW